MFHVIVDFFHKREEGQDLSEYCLLAALVALIALAVFVHASGGVQNLWTVANTSLGNAGTTATDNAGGANGSSSRR